MFKKVNLFGFVTMGASILILSGCASKEPSKPSVPHPPSKIVVIEKHVEPDNIIIDPLDEEDEQYYIPARTTKIWIAAYKTRSDMRVRDHFVDIWVKKARFKELETIPPYLNEHTR